MIGEQIRVVETAENGVELRSHGTRLLPVGAYNNDYTKREAAWHWHREFELIHVTKGSLKVSVPNEQIILKSGELVFINSGVMHAAANAGEGECLFHAVVFSPDFLCNGVESVLWQKYISPLMENSNVQSVKFLEGSQKLEKMQDFAGKCWSACEEEPFGFEFIVREELSKFLCEIIASSKNEEQTLSAKQQRTGERAKRMLEFIHENYREELTTEMISSQVNISESECLRCFRQILGTTPIQYVKKYRLQMAGDLLRESEDSITEIAGRCGFQHMSYFAKAFQEMYGVTPREYRKRKG